VLAAIPRTVIGVMPPTVRFPDAPLEFLKAPGDVWIPFFLETGDTERGNQNLGVLARLRPDSSLARGQADLDAIAETFRERFPDRYAGAGRHWRMELISLREQVAGDTRPALLVLLGAVGLVLLIACANVANLMLARGSARRRELAVRNALGAARGRLVRQLLIEALLLVAGGGLLGLTLAIAGVQGLVRLDPGNIPLLQSAGVDMNVLAFAIGLTLATALIIGLVPALRQSRVDPQGALADAGRGSGTAIVRQRLRRLLVVAEVTLAVVVLVASGLLVRSFLAMTRVPLGFDGSGTVAVQLNLPRASYDSPAKIFGFQEAMVERLRTQPGVAEASAVYPLPSSGDGWSGSLFIEGQPIPQGQPEPHAAYAVAMPNYFKTLHVPIVEGRDFSIADAASSPPVAIVDELVAKKFWPGESAVGKRIGPFGTPKSDGWNTIIGVVGHVHALGPRADTEALVYLAALQVPESSLFFVARGSGEAASLPAAVRTSVRDLDPALPLSRMAWLDELNGRMMARDRFNALLLTIFALVSLAIAAVGLGGVMSYLVAQRTREIGIRLALGGRPLRVVGAVMTEGLVMTATGLVLGLVAARALSQLLAGLVFGVPPTDPVTYAIIAVLLLIVAALASYVPARRVLGVDPVSVLRE
jgi:putative ABC transport system permease protein